MVKRRREDEEAQGDSDSLGNGRLKKTPRSSSPSKPVQPRRCQPTRNAKALIPTRRSIRNMKVFLCESSIIPCESSTLRPTMNNPPRNSIFPTAQTQGSKAQVDSNNQYARTPDETSSEMLSTEVETTGNLRNFLCAESKDLSMPSSKQLMDLDQLTSKIVTHAQAQVQDQDRAQAEAEAQAEAHTQAQTQAEAQTQAQAQVQAQAQIQVKKGVRPDAHILKSQEVVDNHMLESEGNAESHIVRNIAEGHRNTNEKQHSSRTCSLNLTEIAARLTLSRDLDEVNSASGQALVNVGKYRVKEEFAPPLRSILNKYGDIAEDSIPKTIKIRSSLLEIVCGIYQELEKIGSRNITRIEIESMTKIVGDLEESSGVKVGWFREKLENISAALQLFKGYSSLREAKTRISQENVRKLKELQVLQDEIAAMKTETEEINCKFFDTWAKMTSFDQSPLLDGLR